MNKIKQMLVVGVATLVVAGCQTTDTLGLQEGDMNTVPTMPSQGSLSEPEYAVKLVAHLLPRRCVTARYIASDPSQTGTLKRKANKFKLMRVYKHSEDNGWYKVFSSSPFASGGIYANTNQNRIVCGTRNWGKVSKSEGVEGTFSLIKVDIGKVLYPPKKASLSLPGHSG